MPQQQLRKMTDREAHCWDKYLGKQPLELGTVNLPRTIFMVPNLNALTLAVYGGLALFQLPGIVTAEIKFMRTQAISVELLQLSLGLDSRKKKLLRQSLLDLVTQQIISVTPLTANQDWTQGWFCCRLPLNFTGESYQQGFTRIDVADWQQIKLKLKKPSEKIKGYAAYLAVQQNIYYHADALKVCYQTQEILGGIYGVSRYSVARTLDQLEAIGALAMNKVLWLNRGVPVERNIITSAQAYDQLALFVRTQFWAGKYQAILS